MLCRMSDKPKQKPDDPEQSKRFIDTARERESDETEEGAHKAFTRVFSPKPTVDHSRSSGKKSSS
jgi:hypothetical protein